MFLAWGCGEGSVPPELEPKVVSVMVMLCSVTMLLGTVG